MSAAREAAAALADDGLVELRQKGTRIDHRGGWRGPVRIAWIADEEP